MDDGEQTLEGWDPRIGEDLPLERVIDLAFDYRGNTTIVKADGSELHGYVFNRNADVPRPFIQVFDADGMGPVTIPYSEIRTVRFSGRDMAAGKSYAAWLRRKEREKAEAAAGGSGGR